MNHSDEILSILREEIEQYDNRTRCDETGTVIEVGDGIATVYGLNRAVYGELVQFDTGVHGIVLDLKRDSVGVVLLGSEDGLHEGSAVSRTGRAADVPVGDAMIGRTVNALGEPIDGLGPIETTERRPIEREASGVVSREPVNQPMQTGILAIDSMVPIGRGQRELIIGDRQTGKTSIAIDTILNQKGQDMICIYVAIGQKASTVARLRGTLEKYGALDYSIIVSATAADGAPQQYIAPYAGAAIGEYFMSQGRDVLIVYDDLSKHAVAYRTLSLLLHRSPGREASFPSRTVKFIWKTTCSLPVSVRRSTLACRYRVSAVRHRPRPSRKPPVRCVSILPASASWRYSPSSARIWTRTLSRPSSTANA